MLYSRYGGDVNKKQEVTGNSALHYAVREDKKETVKTLITSNAEVDIEDSNKRSPIHIAAEKGNSQMINILAQKTTSSTGKIRQANIHKKDANGRYYF